MEGEQYHPLPPEEEPERQKIQKLDDWGLSKKEWTRSVESPPPPIDESEPRRGKQLRNITWSDGSTFVVASLGRSATLPPMSPLFSTNPEAHNAVYTEAGKQPVDFGTVVTPGHTIDYIGADSFWAYDVNNMISGSERRSTVAADPDKLESIHGYTLAIFHELGHSFLYEGVDELLFEIASGDEDRAEEIIADPRFPQLKPYFEKMVELAAKYKEGDDFRGIIAYGFKSSISVNEQARKVFAAAARMEPGNDKRKYYYQLKGLCGDFNRVLEIFHERIAWAFAMKKARELELRFGFKDNKSMTNFAESCLGTYSRVRNDQRFSSGVAERDG